MDLQRKNRVRLAQIFGIVALFCAFVFSGCEGVSTKGTAASCEANTAQIIVYEGAMKRVCGCSEGTGTFNQPNSLSCTVSFNTVVYFYFVGISNAHQIAVTNIGSTQQVDANSSVKTAALLMNQVGSLPFQDIFNGIGGTITVNP